MSNCTKQDMSSTCLGWMTDVQGGAGRGLTSSEVLNDEATQARVCLRGQANGLPFLIERSVKRSASCFLIYTG